MAGRRWTVDEEEFARQHYQTRSAEWIGLQMGRSKAAVLMKLDKLGLKQCRPRNWWRGEFVEFVRQSAAAGLLDQDIAERWNSRPNAIRVDRRITCYIRHSASIGYSEAQEAARLGRRQAAQRKQCQVLGVQSVKDISRRAVRKYAISQGWPLECSRFECRVLNALQDGRPKTRMEIVEAMGGKATFSRGRRNNPGHNLQSFDTRKGSGTVLGNLAARGLIVISANRPRRGQGKGNSVRVYWLSAKAAEYHRRATRRKCG